MIAGISGAAFKRGGVVFLFFAGHHFIGDILGHEECPIRIFSDRFPKENETLKRSQASSNTNEPFFIANDRIRSIFKGIGS